MRSPLLDRDRLRLAGVHPELIRVVERARLAVPFIVVEGLRSRERQERLVAIGASQTLNSRTSPATPSIWPIGWMTATARPRPARSAGTGRSRGRSPPP
jgi:hypothetical protein